MLGIILVMDGRADKVPCGFCRRLNKVELKRDGRQNAICRCGARYFRRIRKLRGRLMDESGWKKGKQRALYL